MGRTKLFITKRIGPMDFPLMITTLLLVLIGIVAVFSASFYSSISESGSPYGFAIKQVVFAIMGLICMVLATKMNYHVWRTFAIPILGVSFFLLVIVIAGAGTTVNGATRWIRIFGFSLMPGEISKFSMIIATGIALPFISYGGNALIIFMTCSGILLNISKKRTIERNYTVEKYII